MVRAKTLLLWTGYVKYSGYQPSTTFAWLLAILLASQTSLPTAYLVLQKSIPPEYRLCYMWSNWAPSPSLLDVGDSLDDAVALAISNAYASSTLATRKSQALKYL